MRLNTTISRGYISFSKDLETHFVPAGHISSIYFNQFVH